MSKPITQPDTKSLGLALQGGGSHGAFTWGVLDRLLEDERINIDSISGTSAGAVNAVVLVEGLIQGGRDGARKALRRFWEDASQSAWLSLVQRTPWDKLMGNWNMDNSPGFIFADMLTRIASPYDWNPLNYNPLRDLLSKHVDFDAIPAHKDVKLFISATNVRSGRVRVFQNKDLSADSVMASACLPTVFPAVEIDGEGYWDGGFTGNPALHPLIYHSKVKDIMVVQINPFAINHVPRTAREIADRVNEITFNSSLLAELRAIRFVTRQLDSGHLDEDRYKRIYLHRVDSDDDLGALGASSKFNTEWAFLLMLFAKGRLAADSWLEENYERIGKECTLKLDDVLVS